MPEGLYQQEIGEVFRPVHIKWQTIRRYPGFLRTRPVGFPKTISPFGIGGIHDFNRGTPFDFKRLDSNRTFNDRRNYYIII